MVVDCQCMDTETRSSIQLSRTEQVVQVQRSQKHVQQGEARQRGV
jgi:hypothetical protein